MPTDPMQPWKPSTAANVEDHITGLLTEDSPLMKQAQFAGASASNARGLQNSSIGVGAGQNEAYKAALPIAAQDASQENQQILTKMGIDSTKDIATMNTAAQDRQNTAAFLASNANTYSNLYNSIIQNENLPAAFRNEQLTNIKAILDQNNSLAEQLYQVDLDWT